MAISVSLWMALIGTDYVYNFPGLLQILAGGAGGALLGGGLMWSLLQTGYRQIQNANQPTARWRRILNFIVRAFRVVRDVQRRRQDGRLDNEPVVNPNEPADVVRNFRGRNSHLKSKTVVIKIL